MRTPTFRLLLALAVIVLTSAAQAQSFVQITDPQLGFMTRSADFTPEKELMQRIVQEVNQLKPDFVVFSGDMVHERTDENALRGFDELRRLIDQEIPVLFLPGNHDVGNEAKAEEVAAFVRRYGSDRFVCKERTYTLIGYNSCVIKAGTEAEAAEFAWLKKQLKRASHKKPLILIAHHPLFVREADEAETYENIPPVLRRKYLELFRRYGVSLVLAGHLHKCARGAWEGIPFITSGAAGRPLGKDKPGFTLVTITDGRPDARYYEVEQETK